MPPATPQRTATQPLRARAEFRPAAVRLRASQPKRISAGESREAYRLTPARDAAGGILHGKRCAGRDASSTRTSPSCDQEKPARWMGQTHGAVVAPVATAVHGGLSAASR